MTNRTMNPWIDRRVQLVRSAAAAEYLRHHDWDPVPCPNENVQMFAGPIADSGRRITQPVPLLEDAGDYVKRIVELITNLAIIEDRLAIEVLDEMLGVSTPSLNGTANGKPAAKEHAPTA